MTPTEFSARLITTARRTGLTASDLAVWFDRPRPTVRTWLVGANKPSATGGQIWTGLVQHLLWLEQSDAFPIPFDRTCSRVEWIKQARDYERLRSVRQGPAAAPAPTAADIGF
jgi:hypothetical protein